VKFVYTEFQASRTIIPINLMFIKKLK